MVQPTGNKEARYKTMWFCPNDKDQCVLGDVGDFVKGKSKFLHVWLFLLGLKSFQWRWHPWKRLDFVFLGVPMWTLGVQI